MLGDEVTVDVLVHHKDVGWGRGQGHDKTSEALPHHAGKTIYL